MCASPFCSVSAVRGLCLVLEPWQFSHHSLSLKCFSVLLLSLRLTTTVIPPSLSLFTLVTLDRAAYGQLKTKERKKKNSIRWKSVGSKTTLATMTLTFFFTISLFVCVPIKKKVYWKLGVSPIKDFHSRIGIFKSCRYSTDSRNICLGVWSKYITKSQVRHSQTLNKIINAKLLFLPPFFMSWTLRSETFLYTQKAYFSQILFTNLSKSVLVSTSPLPR